MKHLGLIGLLLLGTVVSQTVLAEKVYTWTDAKGGVHYGAHPPKDTKATLVKTRTGHSDPTPAQTVAAQPAPAAAPVATNQETSLKDPERCAAARENLEILNTVAKIKTADADGVLVILTEEDKNQQRIATQKVIDQACE